MLDQEFHFMILRCFQRSNNWIVREVNKIGLCSGQPKILEYLLENDGATPSEIACGCALDKSTIASLLLRMGKMHLITKTTNQEDGRSVNIFLTESGRQKAKEVKEICGVVDTCAMSGISEADRETFTKTLDRIIKNLQN